MTEQEQAETVCRALAPKWRWHRPAYGESGYERMATEWTITLEDGHYRLWNGDEEQEFSQEWAMWVISEHPDIWRQE